MFRKQEVTDLLYRCIRGVSAGWRLIRSKLATEIQGQFVLHTSKIRLSLLYKAMAVIVVAAAIFYSLRAVKADNSRDAGSQSSDDTATQLEAALYTRTAFFGSQALVPYPTAEARDRIAAVFSKHPEDPLVLRTLAEFDEKLGRVDDAVQEMNAFARHETDKSYALETLASFLDRRAMFDQEGETIERLLQLAPPADRAELFGRLVEFARVHSLAKYQTAAFYQQILEQNPTAFEIIEQYVQKLADEQNYTEALKVLRQAGDQVPNGR